MSRLGKKPVPIPAGVTLQAGQSGSVRTITAKGPKGELTLGLRPEVEVAVAAAQATVSTNGKGDARAARAFHGMTRALINSMVQGVAKGYEKRLEIVGVGWNAAVQGRQVALSLGYAEPVKFDIPPGVNALCPSATTVVISGADKQAVGQLAARLRKCRPPEPYKGKGVRYQGEQVRRKAGKSFGS
jgi:large subunit ribosomal protein L6